MESTGLSAVFAGGVSRGLDCINRYLIPKLAAATDRGISVSISIPEAAPEPTFFSGSVWWPMILSMKHASWMHLVVKSPAVSSFNSFSTLLWMHFWPDFKIRPIHAAAILKVKVVSGNGTSGDATFGGFPGKHLPGKHPAVANPWVGFPGRLYTSCAVITVLYYRLTPDWLRRNASQGGASQGSLKISHLPNFFLGNWWGSLQHQHLPVLGKFKNNI
jgi:hypothetical protein